MARVQRGLHSSGYHGPQLSNQERRISHMHAVIDEFVGAEAAGALRIRVEPPEGPQVRRLLDVAGDDRMIGKDAPRRTAGDRSERR